jgi:RHS repeat-associated protein
LIVRTPSLRNFVSPSRTGADAPIRQESVMKRHTNPLRLGLLASLLLAPVLAFAAPSVIITSPANGDTASAPGSFTVSASVTSSANIQYVDFYANGVFVKKDMTAPYSFTHSSLAVGTYTYTATATDVMDAESSPSPPVTVTVNSGANVAPSVNLASPANGDTAVAPATLSVTATAADSDGTIASVQFLDGATVVNTDTSAPYSFTYSGVAAGTHVIKAIATDNAGATATSATATVTVTSAPNAPPTITLVSPATGSWTAAPGSFTLSANASDAGGSIAKVEFKKNGAVVYTDTTAPYSYTLGNLAAGTYTITATATDNGGATATSTTSTVRVDAAPTAIATRWYVYDQFHRLCKVINPESGSTVIDYDGAGNIAWKAEGLNLPSTTACDRTSVTAAQKTVNTYDARNRLTAVSTPNGTADVVTTYYADGKVNSVTAANPGGNNVTTTYVYNKRRLLTGESASNGATLYSLGYAYDVNGFLGTETYPDNQSVSYWPDALGRTTKVGVNGGQTYASNITYFPGGAISGFRYGNGIVRTMEQNDRRMPGHVRETYCATGCTSPTVFLDDTYAFDKNGNVTDVTDQAQAGKTTRGMAYDGLDRLTAAVSPQQWGNAAYSYDALDNLRSLDQDKVSPADTLGRHFRYNYGANNQLATIKDPSGATLHAFTYDTRGNTLGKTGANAQIYAFDFANRMNEVTGKQVYRYDGLGRRVQTTDADGKATFWIYSQAGQVMYSSEARRSQNISYIYLGNTQVATRAVAWSTGTVAIRYQHTDSLGSPVLETTPARGITRKSYAPFGEVYGAVIDGTGYTGHVMDTGTGLIYMQQRYYDPQVGRFFNIDPQSVDGKAAANFNRFAYANDNPYRFVDPDGRTSKPVPNHPQRQPMSGTRIGSIPGSLRQAYVERLTTEVAHETGMYEELDSIEGDKGGGVRYKPNQVDAHPIGKGAIEVGTHGFNSNSRDMLKSIIAHELWHVRQAMHGSDPDKDPAEWDAYAAQLRYINDNHLDIPAADLKYIQDMAHADPSLTD